MPFSGRRCGLRTADVLISCCFVHSRIHLGWQFARFCGRFRENSYLIRSFEFVYYHIDLACIHSSPIANPFDLPDAFLPFATRVAKFL